MSKVKINLKLNDFEDSIVGILIDNKLKFLLDKKIVTLDIYDNNIVMKRYENDDEYTYIDFNKKNPIAYYYFKQKFPLNITIEKLEIRKNEIEINYNVENQLFTFKISYEGGHYDNRNIMSIRKQETLYYVMLFLIMMIEISRGDLCGVRYFTFS